MRKLSLVLLFVVSSASAEWNKIPSTDFPLDPPPAVGSKAYKADFATLHQYQNERDQKACDLAHRQKYPTYKAFFSGARILTADELERAKEFVSRVMKYTEKVAVFHKHQYLRPRPYDVDATLEPCVERVPGKSKAYPSSHAAEAAAAGCVLSLIYPAKAAALTTYTEYLGELRAIVGVHHPSDVEAGQELAANICKRLQAEDDFKAELRALK